MSTNKGLTGEWINVFMCTSLHQGTSVLQEYRVIPLVHHIRKSFEQVWTYMKWTYLNKFWTSLNTFQHIWTSFKQVWSHLNTFEQVLNKFEHKWTHLNTFEHIWTHIITLEQVLNKSLNTNEHIWTYLNSFEQVLNKFKPIWTLMITFEQVLNDLNPFKHIWTPSLTLAIRREEKGLTLPSHLQSRCSE